MDDRELWGAAARRRHRWRAAVTRSGAAHRILASAADDSRTSTSFAQPATARAFPSWILVSVDTALWAHAKLQHRPK